MDPQANTQYRLVAGTIRAALIKVTVVPVITAAVRGGTIVGLVKPALPGAAVTLQRQSGTRLGGGRDGGGRGRRLLCV